MYVADGLFDFGITGRDCIEERGSEVVSLGELAYSKATSNPARIVLAVGADSPVSSLGELAAWAAERPGRLRVSTEYPELTRRALEARSIQADIALSYGATEAKIPDIADAVVDMTETGSALRAAGLKVIETLLVSSTELIANPTSAADPDKRHAMEQILTLLQGTLEARGRVLVKLNVSAENLEAVLAVLPSMRADDLGAVRRRRVRRSRPSWPSPASTRSSRRCATTGRPTSSSCPSRRSSTDASRLRPLHRNAQSRAHVTSFDPTRGLGTVVDDAGASYGFHATAIADGTRTIAVGAEVVFALSLNPATVAGVTRKAVARPGRVNVKLLPPGARVAGRGRLPTLHLTSVRSPVASRSSSRPRTTARPSRACTCSFRVPRRSPTEEAMAALVSSQVTMSRSSSGLGPGSPWRARP